MNKPAPRTSKSVGAPSIKNQSGQLSQFGISYLSKFKKFEGFNDKPSQKPTLELQIQQKVNSATSSLPSNSERNNSSWEQLYKGEKARNQILQKQNRDLKNQMSAYTEDMREVSELRKKTKDYELLILKYEE